MKKIISLLLICALLVLSLCSCYSSTKTRRSKKRSSFFNDGIYESNKEENNYYENNYYENNENSYNNEHNENYDSDIDIDIDSDYDYNESQSPSQSTQQISKDSLIGLIGSPLGDLKNLLNDEYYLLEWDMDSPERKNALMALFENSGVMAFVISKDGSNTPKDSDLIYKIEVTVRRSNSLSIDGKIKTNITFGELKKSTDGFLWDEEYNHVYSYNSNNCSVSFCYYDSPGSNSKADYVKICDYTVDPQSVG